MEVLLNSFHLNGHTLGFHPQTRKVQPHLLTQGLTLGVKGLRALKTLVFFSLFLNAFKPIKYIERVF